MRIAVYGGSFNPPHIGHQLACAVALSCARPAVDEVWMVPCAQHPFDKPLADYAHRHAMCAIAARVLGGRARVDHIEEELGGASYTLRTLDALIERHPTDEFHLLIGADLVAERPRWYAWDQLSARASFLIVGRGNEFASGQSGGFAHDRWLGVELPPVSSTEARVRVGRAEPTHGLLDEAVRAYIDEQGLYRDDASERGG